MLISGSEILNASANASTNQIPSIIIQIMDVTGGDYKFFKKRGSQNEFGVFGAAAQIKTEWEEMRPPEWIFGIPEIVKKIQDGITYVLNVRSGAAYTIPKIVINPRDYFTEAQLQSNKDSILPQTTNAGFNNTFLMIGAAALALGYYFFKPKKKRTQESIK
jgi:hypothetical protein